MTEAKQPPSPDPKTTLRSVHTKSFPGILERLRVSLVVSTYQAGKVIILRNDGGALNTHFRSFQKPMGIAADGARLTIGGSNTVWHYRNMPAVAPKLEPKGKHDACYLPRSIHVTGDIDIHELAWSGRGELWLVNTRFSSLCTLDEDHSFVPRWRPPFVTALSPEDRCHLNGLEMEDGEPAWVTCHGATDATAGWRDGKAHGGVLLDVRTGETLLRDLSMPHSPRKHGGRLWVLESGEGSLSIVDPAQRTCTSRAQFPGFTRGLAFVGPVAFVGLSKVRESAVFSGIPLVDRVEERICGIWAVNVESGEILGFVRFEAGVEEIFAVQVLPSRFPEVLEWGDPRMNDSYVVPDAALADVPKPPPDDTTSS